MSIILKRLLNQWIFLLVTDCSLVNKKFFLAFLIDVDTFLRYTLMGKTRLGYERQDIAMMVISTFIKKGTNSNHFNLDVLGITDAFKMKFNKKKALSQRRYFQVAVTVNKAERLHLEQLKKVTVKSQHLEQKRKAARDKKAVKDILAFKN